MISETKWPILVIGNFLLIFLIQMINDALAPYSVHLYPFALFIFTPLLLLPFTTGLISVVVTGLILDASATLSPGTITIILAVVYTACTWFRRQFKTYSGWHNMLILQSANAVVIAFLTVFINSNIHTSLYFWISVLSNLILSQILLLFIASWFLNLQNSLLNLFGAQLKDPNAQNQVDNLTIETS